MERYLYFQLPLSKHWTTTYYSSTPIYFYGASVQIPLGPKTVQVPGALVFNWNQVIHTEYAPLDVPSSTLQFGGGIQHCVNVLTWYYRTKLIVVIETAFPLKSGYDRDWET